MDKQTMIEWLLYCDKAIGLGFHPDTRAHDYTPPIEKPEEFEANRVAYFEGCRTLGLDPYEFAMTIQPSFRHLLPANHTTDSDCTVNPETNCCDACGVFHAEPCPECGGRGFHNGKCSRSDAAPCIHCGEYDGDHAEGCSHTTGTR